MNKLPNHSVYNHTHVLIYFGPLCTYSCNVACINNHKWVDSTCLQMLPERINVNGIISNCVIAVLSKITFMMIWNQNQNHGLINDSSRSLSSIWFKIKIIMMILWIIKITNHSPKFGYRPAVPMHISLLVSHHWQHSVAVTAAFVVCLLQLPAGSFHVSVGGVCRVE